MFCKVCKDAGKKETEYTSHWVRDAPGPNGKVVCPTLLSTKCKYCKAQGHIVKYCPKLEGKYWDHYTSNISTVKVTYKSTPTASQEAQKRARELCSSPPPAAPHKGDVNPTPIGKKSNYFQLLKVNEEDDEKTTSVIATLKPDYLAIAKSGVEKVIREWERTKETQLQNYKEDLENNFPALGQANTTKSANTLLPSPPITSVKNYSSAATAIPLITNKYEREDSPTPSPVSSRPHTPPNKMPILKEEEDEEKLWCGGCKSTCTAFCDNLGCEGTPPPPSPPPPSTWKSWADVE
jgi:hypothetical protein